MTQEPTRGGNERLERIETRLDHIERDVTVLKADVAVLKADVGILRTDVAVLKTDMAETKSQVNRLELAMKHGFDRVDAQFERLFAYIERSELRKG